MIANFLSHEFVFFPSEFAQLDGWRLGRLKGQVSIIYPRWVFTDIPSVRYNYCLDDITVPMSLAFVYNRRCNCFPQVGFLTCLTC